MNLNTSIEFLQAMIDALPFNIAVLDNKGFVRMVNKAWIEFAKENGLNSDEVGANYLEITSKAIGSNEEGASYVLEALKKAVSGEEIHTFVEYPCHSPKERRYFHVHINSFKYNGEIWIIMAHENVTEEVLNREKKEKFFSRFKKLFDNMNEGVVIHEWIRNEEGEIIDYKIIDVNKAFSLYTDLSAESSVGVPATILYGVNPPPYFDVYLRVYENQKPEQFETFYPPMNRYFWISAIPWDDGFVTIFLDISPIKKQQQILKENLEKNQFLFRELQHRAKNTFASIASLIGLTALNYKGEINDTLQHLKEQVSSMAKVYDILYQKGGIDNINLAEYLSKVLNGFFDTFSQIFSHVNKEIKLEEIILSSQKGSLVGLWLIEVLNNSIKYAFGERRQGWISINLTRSNDEVILVYTDGGREKGEEPNLKIELESSGFGSKIMKIIVEELGGQQEILKGDGIKIILSFPFSMDKELKEN
ncbi:MAG: PAS domain-containing protein [Brevinematales bacterium]|nr:PAS domain-containing protein [Brevinematales bacterium]